MKQISIAAKVPANKEKGIAEKTATLTVNYVDAEASDINKELAEAVQMFGAKALLTNAFANWRVTLQGGIRAGLEKGETPTQIQARLGTAKMGIATQGAKVDVEQAFMAKYASSTPEQRKKMLSELEALAKK